MKLRLKARRIIISRMFRKVIAGDRLSGILLLTCTIISLGFTNSIWQHNYLQIWNFQILNESFAHWINDGLMAVFFLYLGIELKIEFVQGIFSNVKKAVLPIFAAIGGMLVPALFHFFLNYGLDTQSGAGIPMATDAAFALAILSLFGSRVPISLKIFLIALAVIDDLCAIIVIAVFYTQTLVFHNLTFAILVFILLLVLKKYNLKNIFIYLIGGFFMWYFMLHSGVHATISGVLLAFALPHKKNAKKSIIMQFQDSLSFPVSFIILPLFALANTCILIDTGFFDGFFSQNNIGIISGLVIGKPIGVLFFCFVAVYAGIASLPSGLVWKHILGVGLLAGIGFTISMFITLLAFDDISIINSSKLAVLTSSAIAALLGAMVLFSIKKKPENHLL